MKYIILVMLLASSIWGTEIEKKEWGKYFKDRDCDGCFVLLDNNNNTTYVYNKERAGKQFLPASTFKIPNSIFALDSKVIKDENEIIEWDGVQRSFKDWNQNINLSSAIKVSCVWFYQELARRMGFEKLDNYVNSCNYGNKNINGKVDTFWLEGDLRISAYQQIEFLKSFYFYKLPFENNTIDIVKKIIVNETTPKYKLSAKTGWADLVNNEVGWWVGYVEKDNNTYFFALNMKMTKLEQAKLRIEIAKEILKEMGIIE